jgi:hypothetical protein
VNNRLRRGVARGDTPRMRSFLVLVFWLLAVASPLAQAQVDAQAQRDLIDAQISSFAGDSPGPGRVFFVGFAGYGEERVFAEEIKLAARIVGEKYGSSQRSVLLLNDRRDRTTWPLASASSLRYSLKALARVMNPEKDVLFLTLSSHGSRDATIDVSNEGLTPQTLSAQTLAEALDESGIRWKVIVISACFSGTFIKPLADDRTIVITAAARNRTSFGCSDTRHLTYFGEAFFKEALPYSTYLRVAFDSTRKEIRRREREERILASNPQSSFGALMEAKLREIERARSPTVCGSVSAENC